MPNRVAKTQINQNRAAGNLDYQGSQSNRPAFQFADNRPETQRLTRLQDITYRRTRGGQAAQSLPQPGPAIQRMIDKDNNTQLNDLNDLNTALFKLNPQITGVSLSMFQTRGANLTMLNAAIRQNYTTLYDGMKRGELLTALRGDLSTIVGTHAATYTYDTHGDKHFPGGPSGTKFTANSGTVNPKLVNLIRAEIGRIRRDANGKNQTYYYTGTGIPECNGKDLTIQIDFDYAADTITYHGYPDDNVTSYSLSRTKGGTAI